MEIDFNINNDDGDDVLDSCIDTLRGLRAPIIGDYFFKHIESDLDTWSKEQYVQLWVYEQLKTLAESNSTLCKRYAYNWQHYNVDHQRNESERFVKSLQPKTIFVDHDNLEMTAKDDLMLRVSLFDFALERLVNY